MPHEVDIQMEYLCDTLSSQLLDAYNCRDWEMSFTRFSEIFTAHMLDVIYNMREEIDGQEEEE